MGVCLHFLPLPLLAGKAKAARVAPLLAPIAKKGLIGLDNDMIQELADATEEGDDDHLEGLIIAAWVKHIDSSSEGGE